MVIFHLTDSKAFDEKELTSTMDWSEVSENRVVMITGRGQMVYWKGCNVTVFKKDSDGEEQARCLEGMPDGQGIVESGTKLYITYKKVKEE